MCARRWPGDQSDARRRPDRGWRGAGPRPRVDGGVLPRQGREPARLSDPDDRRHAAGRVHPDRGGFFRRSVRRQGHRRAGADSDGASDLQRHPSRNRGANPPRASDAGPRAPGPPRSRENPSMSEAGVKIRCDACPVLCYIRSGMTGACDRYANRNGQLVRVDPHLLLDRTLSEGGKVVPFVNAEAAWSGGILRRPGPLVTAVGAGTTYPDYKPAPFIVSSKVDGADMVTVVTEGIYSYCGVKLKIDTDRHLGAECAIVRAEGEPVGHVTTGEYGSQMLSLGGVNHLTHGGKKEGRVTCDTLLNLCNGKAVELVVDGGASMIVQAGKAPIIGGKLEERMRVGCGSATIGMFAKQWGDKVDEVVVVDDHITGVLSEHQAGKLLGMRDTGIRMKGRRSTPGRYFHVAEPGTGWGGTNVSDPLDIVVGFNPKVARSGMTMLMVSTTGEQHAFYRLDEDLRPIEAELPETLRESVERISENCEPALCSVLFMAGGGGVRRGGRG